MATNSTVITLSDGRSVLLSYGVPVAAFIPGTGYVRTATKYSVTTSRHASEFAGYASPLVDAAAFATMVAPIATR